MLLLGYKNKITDEIPNIYYIKMENDKMLYNQKKILKNS